MIDGISNPFMRAVDATGNIKKYQIIVGGLLLMIVPISYVVLKLGGAPYSVFIVHIVISMKTIPLPTEILFESMLMIPLL